MRPKRLDGPEVVSHRDSTRCLLNFAKIQCFHAQRGSVCWCEMRHVGLFFSMTPITSIFCTKKQTDGFSNTRFFLFFCFFLSRLGTLHRFEGKVVVQIRKPQRQRRKEFLFPKLNHDARIIKCTHDDVFHVRPQHFRRLVLFTKQHLDGDGGLDTDGQLFVRAHRVPRQIQRSLQVHVLLEFHLRKGVDHPARLQETKSFRSHARCRTSLGNRVGPYATTAG